jgi:hypothetical protein
MNTPSSPQQKQTPDVYLLLGLDSLIRRAQWKKCKARKKLQRAIKNYRAAQKRVNILKEARKKLTQ